MVRMPRAGLARPAAVATALALGGALLVGCNGSDAPTTSTTSASSASSSASSASTSPSPSSSSPTTSAYVPVKPTFPAAAKKQTDAGAIAFVEYYWDALSYAWSQPDSSILDGLSTKQCEPCASFDATAADMQSAGHKFDRAPILLLSSEIVFNTRDEASVQTQVERTAASVIDQQAKVVKTNTSSKATRVLRLTWSGKWQVAQIVEG